MYITCGYHDCYGVWLRYYTYGEIRELFLRSGCVVERRKERHFRGGKDEVGWHR